MNERVWGFGGMSLTAEIRSIRINSRCSPTHIIHDKLHMDWSVVIEKEILDKVLVNKTNRHTEFQFYWYNNSTCFGEPFCLSSASS